MGQQCERVERFAPTGARCSLPAAEPGGQLLVPRPPARYLTRAAPRPIHLLAAEPTQSRRRRRRAS